MYIMFRGMGRGVFRGGEVRGAPLDFQNLRRKSTVAHHSNRKRDKEEEGRRKKKKYIVSGVMMAKETPPHPLFPPSYISLSPFLPFFL